jgi:predicted transcriptional regulator
MPNEEQPQQQQQQPADPVASSTGLKHITELEARIIFVLRKFGPATLSEIKRFWDSHGWREQKPNYHRALKRLLEHGVVSYDGVRYAFNEAVYDEIKHLPVKHMREETKKRFGYE